MQEQASFVQALQILDIIFAILGWTKTGLIPAVLQTCMRMVVININWNLCPKDNPVILLTLVAFAQVEVIRYPYYALKQVEDKPSLMQNVFGSLRYNTFILVYPFGAFCELVSLYYGLDHLANPDGSDKFSLEMPNVYNFAFSFRYYIYCTPVLYMMFFPGNYFYMWDQRKKYYAPPASKVEAKSN
jgi:very-long-chain (3R)-3-hydroxyacyl-CoA dehydratase